MLEPADEDRGDVLGIAGEFDRLQPRHQLGEEAVDLHPGQRRTETEVHAVAERVVLVRVMADVKPEWVVEDLFVTVGRRSSTDSPAAIGTPRTVVSSRAERMNSLTGVTQRIISSAASGVSSGLSLSRAS